MVASAINRGCGRPWPALLAVVALLWLLRYLVGLVLTSSGVVNPWSRRNRSRRIRVAIEQGQLDLAEGRWASAQRHLHRAAEAERQPLLYYLGAARAANEQGRTEDSDNLLERAWSASPGRTGHCPDPCPVADGPW
jgi:HemY protein